MSQAAQSWNLTQGRQAHLACWRAGGTHRRAMGILDSTCEKHVSAGLLPRWGRGLTEDCSSGCPVSCDHPSTCSSLNQVNAPATLTSPHSSALEQGLPGPGRELTKGIKRKLGPWVASDGTMAWWGLPLLMLTQAAHQGWSQSVTAAGLPQPVY